MSKVYVGMSADILHIGHLNLIEKAATLGEVVVGVLTDKAISEYKRVPYMKFEDRIRIISNLKYVTETIPQNSLSYKENILKIKPKFVVHGDDWVNGVQSKTRQEVIETLNKIGGELIEFPYTKGVSSTDFIENLSLSQYLPQFRLPRLRRILEVKEIIRVIESHNGLSALIVDRTKLIDDGKIKEYDAIWLSSLTDSLSRGLPDIEVVDISSRINTIGEITQVTAKPIIFDADTGGQAEHLFHTIQNLERVGVSAAIIEDKTGLKQNSLLGNDVFQAQADKNEFSDKIKVGKSACRTDDFMLIARIESLILDKPVNDALERADCYLDAGADGIMIHSRNEDGKDVNNFCLEFKKNYPNTPLVIVPTTFNHIKIEEFADWGVNIVIYANQLMRAAFPEMVNAAEKILKFDRSSEIEKQLLPIKEILKLIPGEKR